METLPVQATKLAIAAATGLDKDALHIYIGLAVFFATASILKKPIKSIWPWFAVLVIAIAGELLDRRDDIASLGYWRWKASLHDIINTQFWPAVILLLARFSRLMGDTNEGSQKLDPK
ncbi:MAG: hypothetical protein H7Y28_15520 [Rhodoferax sp.]|nr:hypothetical protein [Rhodoferax sp.]